MSDSLIPFGPRQRLELDACTRCGECVRICESYAVTGDTGSVLMGMIQRRRDFHRREHGLLGRLFGWNRSVDDEWQAYMEGVFSCTLCGRCVEVCPVNIDTRTLALAMREELVTHRRLHPENLGVARDAVEEHKNVFGMPNDERTFWAEFLDDLPDGFFDRTTGDVLYYVGCVSSFSPAVQEIPQAFLTLLLRAGVDVIILGEREWCCGFPLIMGGMFDQALPLIRHNLHEAVDKAGVSTIVFNCPSCYYTWAKYLKPPGVKLYHATQYARVLQEEGRLKFRATSERVTYHDPCDLSRGMKEVEAPRAVLRSVPDLDFVELAQNREMTICCGGGGDVEMSDASLVEAINVNLTDAIVDTQANLVIQGCPQCKRQTMKGLREQGNRTRTLDMVEFALEYGVFPNDEDWEEW